MSIDREQSIEKELIRKAIPILMEYPDLFMVTRLAQTRANPDDAKSHIFWQLEALAKIPSKEAARHIAFFDPFEHSKNPLSDLLIKRGLLYVIKAFLPSIEDIDFKQWDKLLLKHDLYHTYYANNKTYS